MESLAPEMRTGSSLAGKRQVKRAIKAKMRWKGRGPEADVTSRGNQEVHSSGPEEMAYEGQGEENSGDDV